MFNGDRGSFLDVMILTSIALQFRLFERAQILLLERTNFGDLGTRIEEKLFQRESFKSMMEEPKSAKEGSSSKSMQLPVLPKITRAPEFAGLGPWHNSEPFTLASLKGKVVLVDFWTYSCINCIRTLPYIQGYWEKFGARARDSTFMLIGVHTPEFVFEKNPKNVAEAIRRHGLTYPVAQDNDFGTWNAFANHYWPAKYLIDANGYIRYTHFGEGAYEETESAIMSLLDEIGVTVSESTLRQAQGDFARRNQTPETYLGERSWHALENAKGAPTDDVTTYEPLPSSLHSYVLGGEWQLQDGERQVLRSSLGEIRMRFLGGEINLVLGLADDAKPFEVMVEIDGKSGTEFTVDHHDLYSLWKGEYGEHEIIIRFRGTGVEGYAFTFGS